MLSGKCCVCGKEFTYLRGVKFTCSPECQKKRTKELNTGYKKKPQPVKKKKDELLTDALAAKAMGISYGQYMARKQREKDLAVM